MRKKAFTICAVINTNADTLTHKDREWFLKNYKIGHIKEYFQVQSRWNIVLERLALDTLDSTLADYLRFVLRAFVTIPATDLPALAASHPSLSCLYMRKRKKEEKNPNLPASHFQWYILERH